MGVDLKVRVKTRQPLTEKQRVDLEFHMRHRFREVMWPAHSESEFAHIRIATEYDSDTDCERPVGDTVYDVPVWCRWYGEGYERGPALDIFGLLTFLRHQSFIERVEFGGDHDDEWQEATDLRLQAMLARFLEVGNLPYQGFFDKDKDGDQCCGHQMIRYGWGRSYAAWFCAGCGKKAIIRDGVKTYRKAEEME